jgi:hypothetical protein
MLFCPKCAVELEDEDTFCSKCGYKLKKKDKESRTTKVISTLDELVQEKKPSQQNGMFTILVIVSLIIIILFILSAIGVTDAAFKGSGINYLDPCEREFKECNKECGEGLLSGVCKDICTVSYRQCRN